MRQSREVRKIRCTTLGPHQPLKPLSWEATSEGDEIHFPKDTFFICLELAVQVFLWRILKSDGQPKTDGPCQIKFTVS